MSVITATELAEKLRHAPQVMYADIVSLYVESILDEIQQDISEYVECDLDNNDGPTWCEDAFEQLKKRING